MNKRSSIIIIILICAIGGLFCLGAKSCVNRSRNKTKSGSSVSTFAINAPSNLIANAISPYQINLSWADNSNNEDGFEIERKVGTNGNYMVIARVDSNTTSYSDTGVYPGSTYYYRARAFNTIGDVSFYSNEIIVSSGGVITIGAGDSHSFAIDADFRIWSWGNNDYGQLGLGDTVNRNIPNRIDSDFDWVAFNGANYAGLGLSHSTALKTDGTIWSWGSNGRGQLGTGDTFGLYTNAPDQVDANSDWASIAVGFIRTIAIKTNGTIYSWGGNSYGELGMEGTDRYTPTQMGTDSDWVSLVSGPYHTIARKTNPVGSGTLWGWGHNYYGQLGDGTIYTIRYTPLQIGTDSDWAIIAAGGFQSFGIKSNYTLWTCGNNQYGQLGLGDTANRNTITQIGTANDWLSIATGGNNLYGHSVAIKINRSLYSCGLNSYGQLGLGDTFSRNTLTQIGTDMDWSVVSAGGFHTIALKDNETIWVWGKNNYGQLGLTDTNNRYNPTQVRIGIPGAILSLTANFVNQSQIDLSWVDNFDTELGFSIERKIGRNGAYVKIATVGANTTSYSDRDVSPSITYYYRLCPYNAWGYGQYSNEVWMALSGDWSDIATGNNHAVALKTNGSLWSWGLNDNGQLGLGDAINRTSPMNIGTNNDWSSVAAGTTHSLAINNSRTIFAWGLLNEKGQLGLGDTNNRLTPSQIDNNSDWSMTAAGFYHTIGLKTNKILWGWGDNSMGQLGISGGGIKYTPAQINTDSDWSIADCGFWHTLALKTNSTLWAWGLNNFGQLGLGDTYVTRYTPTQVGTDSDWTIIATGWQHSLAGKNNGTLWSTGDNDYGQLGLGPVNDKNIFNQISYDSDWIMVDSKLWHVIAMKSNGTLWAWGGNGAGQLGVGDLISRNIPTLINSISDCYTVRTGGEYTLAIMTNNTAWSWGQNDSGQLGINSPVTYRNIPTMIEVGSPNPPSYLTATAVSYFLIDLTWIDSYNETEFKIERKSGASGTYEQIAIVGANMTSYSDTVTPSTIPYYYRVRSYNNAGNSDYSNQVSATTVIMNAPTSLSADYISQTQLDLLWNDNSDNEAGFIIERKVDADGTYEQLALEGINTTSYSDITLSVDNTYYYRVKAFNAYGESNYSNEIVFTNTVGSWLGVSVGYEHSLGIKTNGTIWSWGRNLNGQLGLGDTEPNRNTPTQIITGSDTDWSAVIGGYNHSFALKNSGILWGWGKNNAKQLGMGDTNDRLTPAQIWSFSDWSSRIATGETFTVAIKTDNSLWVWGSNSYGQLGLGDSTTVPEKTTPVRLGIETDWSSIAAGRYYTIALKTNKTLWLWGQNNFGQLGLGDTDMRGTPIQVNSDLDWSAIGASFYTTLAVKANGTIYSWGNNTYGQLGLGDSGTGTGRYTPTQIITGSDTDWALVSGKRVHSVALKNNGMLWGWGVNSGGQLGLGDNIQRNTPAQMTSSDGMIWIYMSAGGNHTIGLKENGTLWAWGNNSYGQLGLGDSGTSRYTPTLVGE